MGNLIVGIEIATLIASPVVIMVALAFPILMMTWAKSVPLTVRLPWALFASVPLVALMAALKSFGPLYESSNGANAWLLALTIIAYSIATAIAIQFRSRHKRGASKGAQ